MITIDRFSAYYANALKSCHSEWQLTQPYRPDTPWFSGWLQKYGGRLVQGYCIEFDNDEDASAFILKFG